MRQEIRSISRVLKEIQSDGFESLGFYGLTGRVAQVLGASGAAVLVIDPEDQNCVQARALLMDGQPINDFCYDCRNTPCEIVVGGRDCVVTHDVQRRFPKDRMLVDLGLSGYAGVPLRSPDGRIIGLIAAFFRKPVADGELILEILRTVASFVGSRLADRISR
ncbi:GAF domain-containing protein [Wenzhouxiangella sp. AB-CW3]|uniref:GAF domain-containing protein n=1 Tax=Wenzhouxiangella sp. AB-CW3 TaxID=2771012 RepID=UPI00168B4667|nr:GAF domain-containing protein [Wenzhouxiangella sp. AB-CW3]QOC21422.1 GAF domain-containing protein [Wenzhouxiangella sp. AB-CW3]